MDLKNVQIRTVVPDDAEELLAIYAPYVEKTAVSFEYEVPGLQEFTDRIRKTLTRYPYFAAESDGEILGYAYTGPFVGRAAYSWSAETTIYLKEDRKRMGLGRKLYEAIEAVSKAQNIQNLNACIGYPEADDGYLTRNSVQFHTHMGYSPIGEFHKCGYKFGRWYSMTAHT